MSKFYSGPAKSAPQHAVVVRSADSVHDLLYHFCLPPTYTPYDTDLTLFTKSAAMTSPIPFTYHCSCQFLQFDCKLFRNSWHQNQSFVCCRFTSWYPRNSAKTTRSMSLLARSPASNDKSFDLTIVCILPFPRSSYFHSSTGLRNLILLELQKCPWRKEISAVT